MQVMEGDNMTDKVFIIKYGNKEFYIDPADYPSLNLVGGETVDRNDPMVDQYFSSLELILERERHLKFSDEAVKFFKKV